MKKKQHAVFEFLEGGINRETINMAPSLRFSQRIHQYLDDFFDLVPPALFRKRLLYVFLLFLSHEKDTLPEDFKEWTLDFQLLFHLLDVMEEEVQKPGSKIKEY